jgi:DNA gyrase subunit A
MSVIVARALPDVRDGLKPVHRRILWGMRDMGVRPDRPHVKSARVTGEVMGKYHPHGDSAIYDSLVRMAQDFSLRLPLVDGHGNFGTPDDPPAAARYTECRLSNAATELLEGIDEDTVDFADNYSNEYQEPVVLPARFPNLLVNGSQGIAVGMATNIPPHNLGEVVDATMHLIDNPEATPDDLMKFIKGPDFPTGAQILGRQGILDAYRNGRGSIRMRAVAEIEEHKGNRQRIVVTEIPYQTSVLTIAQKVADLVNGGDLVGISDVNDESAKGKTRLVIDLKRDANANVVLNNLYKHTPMQTNFAMNTVALVDGVPRTLNLAEVLTHYIAHQEVVIRRRSEFRLGKAQDRAHILEGYIRALDMIDAIIAAIRASEDRGSASRSLQAKPFEFSERQAEAILDLQLYRLTRLSRQTLEDELAKLRETIAELQAILGDRTKLMNVIKTEMAAIRAKYDTPRRAQFAHDPGEMEVRDLITDEPVVVTMTKAGYVKATPADQFRTQARGGRGKAGARLKEEDIVTEILHTTTHAYLLFFSNRGRVFRLDAHQIPVKDRTARGTAIVNLLPLQPDEKVQTVIDTRGFPEGGYFFFATKKGIVKKTEIAEYDKSRREGFIAIKIREDDELVRVIQTTGSADILLISKNGMGIRFTEDDVRSMGRDSSGVIGMKMKADDEVVSCDQAEDEGAIIVVTYAG